MGKYIVVTGASTGIGYYASKKFIEEGYHVFGSLRREEDAKNVRESLGQEFTPLLFDVTDHSAIQKSVKEVESVVGNDGIACLINNAGIAVSGPNTIIGVEEYQKQFDVNFFGVIATTKAFLPLLGAKKPCPHPPGKIMNISSVSGQISFPFMGPYASSKFALEGYSHALRRELMIYGIDVIIIAPGAVKTPIWSKVEDLDAETLNSDYGKIVSGFQKAFVEAEVGGLEVEHVADKMYRIFKSDKPKTRYALVNKKFTKWTIPRYLLSDRMLDGFIRKMFKMK